MTHHDALADVQGAGLFGDAEAEFGVAESVKASSELYLPAAGEVIAVNGDVSQQTDLVNTDPYGKGWLVRIKLSGDKAPLLDAAAYTALVDSIKH